MSHSGWPNFDDWLYTPVEQPDFKKLKVKNLKRAIWTENKARLIQRYLYYFVMVTKHGAYIDAFAGPQRMGKLDAWAAKLVLEGQPRSFYLRHYYFIELDKNKIPLLKELQDQHRRGAGGSRINIDVRHGDCNVIIPQFLATRPISDNEATFCLLDQRTFECHWSTVEALAQYKSAGKNRIELFYFLPNSWLPRAVSRTKNRERLRIWWGRDDFDQFLRSSQAKRCEQFCERLRELGYQHVLPFPILERYPGRRVMYYMIHATDHPAAPKLMTHAYNTAVLPPESEEQMILALENMPDPAAG